MKPTLLLAAALALGTANATDLRIYPSFAEVRQPVTSTGTALNVSLPQQAWENVLAGSLDLEGLAFDSAVQKLETNWLSGLEGKTVFLVQTTADGEKTEPVTLVRARDLLVKDAAGRYFNVRYEQLRFDTPPPTNPLSPSQTLTYSLPKAGSGTLVYLTRSVGWSPRYTLKASPAGAQLSALADIRNTTELPYDVKDTELYSGDVSVQANPQAQASYEAADMVMRAAPAPVTAPKIGSGSELRGLYRYALTTPFTLPANSVVTLPFLTPKLSSFERYVGLNTYFNVATQSGTLDRSYRFKADARLPAGPITVREEGRLVGQTRIDETREGGTVEFSLGDDPDVEYTRTVQTVSQSKDSKGNVVKTTYKVTYAFESSKARSVRAEITERVGGRVVIIDSAAPTKNGGIASLKVDVPAEGKISRSFTVVVDNS
ncbi:DUF4139 domain-containing protein [Deinococcus radiopugnans]|uniref:DUF4139 domain-containing protein n=1 Tax=Deinococcus radiopugnans ATCC 19172 TaxID=585398 RepID=A0A5C4Y600_9DEIO|nr:DUF4139 domain-containing protein [Deinococcus radiopugnans]MBB6016615.1 hypothetical protein [Deinococcus radiopugnans ATCC 19172]TNM70734.1 hypothetical protein FHR04_11210 [Deinococcus radiopugnans ATCC 19172]